LPETKLVDLAEAIERFVPDGSSVAMGTGLESLIPFAAGHELIRRERRNLTLIGPISDILFDQVIGAGAVRTVRAAWVGNVITGSGYNFRRAVESGALAVEDHSNLTLAAGLRAAAMGVPFMPVRTALGSSLFDTNSSLKVITCPFTGQSLTAVAAIRPDVAIVHVQCSDVYGNAHAWGNLGVSREACLAARRVILTAEEIVSPDRTGRDPNRVITPAFKVDAVVRAPWGAHPSPVPGYYNRDHQAFLDYRRDSRTPEGYARWRAHWVDGVREHSDYLALLGKAHRNALELREHAYSESLDYGF
jgi:glutaconate CoA-transferase subunit A